MITSFLGTLAFYGLILLAGHTAGFFGRMMRH